MNYHKELNLTQSKTKAQWWRMGLILGFIVTFGILNFGCDNEDEISVSDEYYVKYEVNSTTIYSGGKLNVTINTEKNTTMTISVNTRTQWEAVIGPVQKGFNATLNVIKEGTADSQLQLYTQISVSKNGSPFALKKIDGSDTPRNSVQINYTIDY
jgi:hypothetical protein